MNIKCAQTDKAVSLDDVLAKRFHTIHAFIRKCWELEIAAFAVHRFRKIFQLSIESLSGMLYTAGVFCRNE